jgi:exosome complex RNA-binding protein Csl4
MNRGRPLTMLVVGLLSLGLGVSYAADAVTEKEATPTIKERLTKETIKGTLMTIKGEYYSIKDHDGKEHIIHVDKSTKSDPVKPGDLVKAYVTDQGHTTTLQRDN